MLGSEAAQNAIIEGLINGVLIIVGNYWWIFIFIAIIGIIKIVIKKRQNRK